MRIDEIRAAGSGADAVVLTSAVSRRYATGFHSTAGACYISARRAVLLTDFRYIEAARLQAQGVEVREIKTGESYTAAVNRLAAADRVKSIALEDETLTCSEYRRWENGLAAQAVPLGRLISGLRQVKDEDEVMRIASAQRIAEQAFSEILNEIRPGVTEQELAARLTYLMLHHGAENMSFDPIVVSGVNSSRPHGVPSQKPVAAGDFVTMDFGCIYQGYCSDMTRTVAVGHVTDEMQAVYDTVLSAQLAGIAAARAGVTGKEVDAAARSVISQAGYGDAFGHGFGHCVGLEIHEEPRASQTADTPLPAGCVLTAEPGVYLPGKFGVRIEDMLYVIEDGCVNLTDAPKHLIVLPA